MNTLGRHLTGTKANNLNAIRLALALGVLLSHCFPLTLGEKWYEAPDPTMLGAFSRMLGGLGFIAVNLFFLISGMLITASWLRSKSMQDYLMKRVLRIYPAYIVAMLFTVAVIWVFCPAFRAGIGGHRSTWLVELGKDLAVLDNRSVRGWSGIFPTSPYPGVGNGSLWTIQIEFSCYLLVAVIGLFCLFKHRWLVLIATAFFMALFSKSLLTGQDVNQLSCRFLVYFMTGMSLWLWRDKIPFSSWLFGLSVVGLVVASRFGNWFAVVFPLLAGYCTIWLGYGPRLSFLHWTEKTDLSYGTYLYAFPVQQIFALHASFRNPWILFLLATPVTLLLAALSWHLVEKRFLAKKKTVQKDFDPGEEAPVLNAEFSRT